MEMSYQRDTEAETDIKVVNTGYITCLSMEMSYQRDTEAETDIKVVNTGYITCLSMRMSYQHSIEAETKHQGSQHQIYYMSVHEDVIST